ncbi:MAG: hypothetical protein M0C28_07365 [Candidatus Moduliflexus flocculans]|nr:hypothetical protein [Candidatus Moduliflexus flocculans]
MTRPRAGLVYSPSHGHRPDRFHFREGNIMKQNVRDLEVRPPRPCPRPGPRRPADPAAPGRLRRHRSARRSP